MVVARCPGWGCTRVLCSAELCRLGWSWRLRSWRPVGEWGCVSMVHVQAVSVLRRNWRLGEMYILGEAILAAALRRVGDRMLDRWPLERLEGAGLEVGGMVVLVFGKFGQG